MVVVVGIQKILPGTPQTKNPTMINVSTRYSVLYPILSHLIITKGYEIFQQKPFMTFNNYVKKTKCIIQSLDD